MEPQSRRATDSNNDEIADLIKLENDPKNRAFLIILQNINLSLIANTQTVNDIDDQLKQHLVEFRTRAEREDELLNKGKGAWKVVSWLLGIAQLFAIAAIANAYQELQTLHKDDQEMLIRIVKLEPPAK